MIPFYYLSMRTLAESLFDKDNITKDITIGDTYEVMDVFLIDSDYTRNGQSSGTWKEEYQWLVNTIKLPLLLKKFDCVKLNRDDFGQDINRRYASGWVPHQDFLDLLGYLIAAIYDIPLVYDKGGKVFDRNNIYNGLLPYLKYFNDRPRKHGGPSSAPKGVSVDFKSNGEYQIIKILRGKRYDDYKEITIYFKKK